VRKWLIRMDASISLVVVLPWLPVILDDHGTGLVAQMEVPFPQGGFDIGNENQGMVQGSASGMSRKGDHATVFFRTNPEMNICRHTRG
jgi:hypothetical protein